MPQRKQKPAALANAKPKPATETKPELPKLTQLQEHVFEVLADMVLRGGHTDNIYDILWNAAAHHQRRRFPRFGNECDQQFNERIDKSATKRADEWQTQIAKSWPEREKTEETLLPKNVIQRVRAVLTERLEDRLHDFILEATPEEKRLPTDVLQNRENISIGPDIEDPELNLATAFMEEIEAEERYIQVPNERIKDLVVGYVTCSRRGKTRPLPMAHMHAACCALLTTGWTNLFGSPDDFEKLPVS
jgi:hypothetical protein